MAVVALIAGSFLGCIAGVVSVWVGTSIGFAALVYLVSSLLSAVLIFAAARWRIRTAEEEPAA